MTAVVKHATRKPLEITNATAEQAQARNSQLREQFPARTAERWWSRNRHIDDRRLRAVVDTANVA
ncbi:hypothetical protein [Streptomyces sp. TRM68367]|uniref:hypothetical protein n=1 Tax=Streptomyces sp. TRM68367 TaxID=2758415 RepID=UPI00165BBD40|nr:hypothetical protein [Streptomyces sp. TRM68367]MBC9731360.1 hypothetical protein [Streptomyces sp. TRM68367]